MHEFVEENDHRSAAFEFQVEITGGRGYCSMYNKKISFSYNSTM